MNKRKLRTLIYRAVGDLTKGIFRDDSWAPVRRIWNEIENTIGARVTILNTRYHGFETKTWDVEVEYAGVTLQGYLVASFCGTIANPMERYDLAFII